MKQTALLPSGNSEEQSANRKIQITKLKCQIKSKMLSHNANTRTYANNAKNKFAVFALNSRGSHYDCGFGLVEIVVVIGIITVALFSFSQTGIVAVKVLRQEKENMEATLLAKETIEAARAVRDESWTNNIAPLANGQIYYPIIENGKWKLSASSPGFINGKYDRYVIFNEVLRDAQDRIAASGNVDAGTRKITSRAQWFRYNATSTIELVTYITNFQSSLQTQIETKTIFFEDSPTDSDLVNFPSENSGDGDPVQSFTTLSSSIKVSKMEVYIKRAKINPSDIFAEIRFGSAVGPVLGTSNIIDSASFLQNLSWVEFRFPSVVNLNPLTKYYIRLRSIPSSGDAFSGSKSLIHWGYKQTPPSPYSGGELRRYVGRLSNPNDQGQLLDQYDAGFRVYSVQ